MAAEKDMPGPGTYLMHACGPTLEYSHDSISKKGYGSMVSRTTRWRGVRPVYSGPGPGEYSARSALEVDQDKYFNRAAATSAFHPPVSVVQYCRWCSVMPRGKHICV